MYALYSHCVFDLNPRACSIDTPLHTFVPYAPRRPPAPERGDRGRRLASTRSGSTARSTATKCLHALAAPGLRHRPAHRVADPREPRRRKGVLLGHHGMSSWSRRRQDLLRDRARDHRPGRPRYIEARDQGERTFGGREAPAARRRGRGAALFAAIAALAARAGLQREALHRHGPGRPEDAALREQRGRAAARRARHVAAPTTSCAPRSSRSSSTGTRRPRTSTRSRRSSRAGLEQYRARLRGLLRALHSGPTRRPCATRTRPSSSFPASA